ALQQNGDPVRRVPLDEEDVPPAELADAAAPRQVLPLGRGEIGEERARFEGAHAHHAKGPPAFRGPGERSRIRNALRAQFPTRRTGPAPWWDAACAVGRPPSVHGVHGERRSGGRRPGGTPPVVLRERRRPERRSHGGTANVPHRAGRRGTFARNTGGVAGGEVRRTGCPAPS